MKAYAAALLRLRAGTATRRDMATVRDYEASHRKDLRQKPTKKPNGPQPKHL